MAALSVDSPRPTRWRRITDRGPGQVAILVAGAVLLRLPGMKNKVLNPDEAYFYAQARVILRGGSLYREAIDRKPPGLPYLMAGVQWVLGHPSLLAMRLLEGVAQGLVASLLALEIRRRYGRAAALPVAVLYLVATVGLETLDAQAFNSEGFVALATIGALVLAGRGRAFAAGSALACALLLRQTGLLFAPAVLLAAWRVGGRSAAIKVAAVPVVVLPVVAGLLGWRDMWFWCLGGGSEGYLSLHGRYRFAFDIFRAWLLRFVTGSFGLLALLALAVHRWRRDLDVWLGLLGGVLAVGTGLRFFDHYNLQLLPWLALAAAGGWATVPPRAGRRLLLGMSVALAAVHLGTHVGSSGIGGPRDPVVAEIRRLTTPDQRIFVWGHASEYYFWADRSPSPRFLTTSFLTGHGGNRPPEMTGIQFAVPGAWDWFQQDVRRNPPELIVDAAAANLRNGRFYPLASYPLAAREVAQHYRRVADIRGVVIYQRR
ncbi:MAG: glycosyltransferase [Acidimicrobiales bacterium]|nr:glycosyltransferase [Acidimicrobiales bacterium]